MEAAFVSRLSKITWAGFGLYEYLLAVQPDASVKNKILEEKQNFSASYGYRLPMKTGPYIPLADFRAKEAMEDTISRYLQRICALQPGFNAIINNYTGIPPHSLLLRIQNNEPFLRLCKELKVVDEYITSCSCPPVTTVGKPYITLAQKLPENLYSKALIDYSQRNFHDIFPVNEIVLLKRKSAFDPYQCINIFRLKGESSTSNLYSYVN